MLFLLFFAFSPFATAAENRQLPAHGFFEDLPAQVMYDAELEPLVFAIVACPHARQLLDQVLSEGSIEVRVGTSAEGRTALVWWRARQRRIVIDTSESFDLQLGAILFGLANQALYKNVISRLEEDIKRACLSQEEYVRHVLDIDYQAGQLMYSVALASIQEDGWPERCKLYMESFFREDGTTSFDEYYGKCKDLKSTQWHRVHWSRYFKRDYCQAYPGSDSCQPYTSEL
jgi:hypothetical protein